MGVFGHADAGMSTALMPFDMPTNHISMVACQNAVQAYRHAVGHVDIQKIMSECSMSTCLDGIAIAACGGMSTSHAVAGSRMVTKRL